MTTKFNTLLAKLETLQKASDAEDEAPKGDEGKDTGEKPSGDPAADDKKIKAADQDGKDKDDDKDDEAFGKAFVVKMADGTEAEAWDGTAMLKALHTENEGLRQIIGDRDTELAKAFDMVVEVIEDQRSKLAGQARQIADQDTLIKALETRVSKLGASGAGRKTMISIAEKLTPGVSPGADKTNAVSAEQVLMKAQFMAREGNLDWGALPRIEAHQGRGVIAPPDLLQRFPELLTPIS